MPAEVLLQAQASAPTKLSYHGKLISPKLTNDALLKRLKGVQGELARMEQETVDVRSIKPIAKELVGAAMLQHKDAGVRASVACCIADVLRLFAPDAPYTPSELKDVFRFFLAQIIAVIGGKSDTTVSVDTVYLLDSLSNVKSIVLIFDLPNAEDLMIDYFRRFLSSAKPDMSKNVEICLADILVHLIDEAEVIPQDVLDLLLAVFTPKALKQKSAGHRLAVEVCTATADRMQKEVAKYFVEVITAAVQEEDAEEQQKQFETAHGLIIELNRAVPALLTSVLPQFEEELRAESVPVRDMAVTTIGRILSEKNENAREFPQKWPAVWRSFLQRATDKVPAIRIRWLEAVRAPLVRHTSLKDDITDAMNSRFDDPDERVRISLIRAIGSLDYETLLHHVPKATLTKLADRGLDRKPVVQAEALMTMGKVFNKAYSEVERRDASALHQFAWIPGAMVEAAYTNAHGLLAVGAAFEAQVLPLPEQAEDEAKWINRLLVVLKHLSSRATTPILNFMNLHSARRSPFDNFLKRCEEYNGGIGNDDPKRAKLSMQWCIDECALLLGGERAAADLLTLAKANDKRLFKLMQTCMDPKSDLKAIVKARADIKKRLEASNSDITSTVFAFLRSSSFVFINHSAVPLLARRLQPGEVDYSATQQDLTQSQDSSSVSRSPSASTTFQEFKDLARTVLEKICKHCPVMLVPYADDFIRATASARDHALSEISLQALAAILVQDGQAITVDRRFVERCGRFVMQGTPTEAKYAARFLANGCCDADAFWPQPHTISSLTRALATRALDHLLEQLAVGLSKATDEELVRHLGALGQCFKRAPKLSDNIAESVIRAIVGVILPRKWSDGDAPMAANEDWALDAGMHPWLQAKVLGLNLLVKRCVAFAAKKGSEDMVKPVMRLLWQTLATDEQSVEESPTGHLARLRLAAATGLIKLARFPQYDALIRSEFVTLAFTVQDVCFGVRQRFLRKVLQYLTQRRLPSRFNVIGFLSAVDPEAENKSHFTTYVHTAVRSMPVQDKYLYFDIAFTRFLHLLAHHPDFDRQAGPEGMGDFMLYIDFYLSTLVSAENIGLYFHLAAKLKTVRDKETMDATDNLYALSEFAQLLIKRRARLQGWTIDTYPGKVKLPSDIFAPLPSPEVRNEIYSHQYLPAQIVEWLTEVNKPVKTKVPKATAADSPKKRKAADAPRRKSNGKRRRSSKANDSDEDVVRASDTDSDDDADGADEGGDDDRVSDLEEEIDLTKDNIEGRSARLREKQAREIQARNERRRAKIAKLSGADPGAEAKAGKKAVGADSSDGESDSEA
ncbi:Sister chromatid cohesion protein pds5 [Tilletia horrida]|nr:Sister chromatid cohesion protein pds5 [Tilletia horrida]KAK0541361.1 Sister chromatid cohesion protein pds5 [Tilletia horrida]